MLKWLFGKKRYVIEVVKGPSGAWFSRIVHMNSLTVWTSETYSERIAAIDSANNAARAFGIDVHVID